MGPQAFVVLQGLIKGGLQQTQEHKSSFRGSFRALSKEACDKHSSTREVNTKVLSGPYRRRPATNTEAREDLNHRFFQGLIKGGLQQTWRHKGI
eukprot:scaffold99759_cov16-Tisochrysis_lutea.AAC.2